MSKPKPEDRDLIREVKRKFRRVKAELEPRLLAEAKEPGKAHLEMEDMRNVLVAQNVLRPCLEATLDAMMPVSHLTCLELAIRLASYAISVAPMEDQDKMVELVIAGLPNAHTQRLAQGVVIRTEWKDGEDGPLKPNFPAAAFRDPEGSA